MAVTDAIVIGAGHNGLAAAAVLVKKGRSVIVLEKNGYVGGMSGTREILKDCRNEVGASCLFPLAKEVTDALDFEGNGAEFIDLPVIAINLPNSGAKPLLFYKNPRKQLAHLLFDHGPRAMFGFVRLMRLRLSTRASRRKAFTSRAPTDSSFHAMRRTPSGASFATKWQKK